MLCWRPGKYEENHSLRRRCLLIVPHKQRRNRRQQSAEFQASADATLSHILWRRENVFDPSDLTCTPTKQAGRVLFQKIAVTAIIPADKQAGSA